MNKVTILIQGMLLMGLSVISLDAQAENPCNGKKDYQVRLDQPGKSLEKNEILDQDSIGVCYATSASTALQSVLPGNPDISYLDYAVQFKKAQSQSEGKALKPGRSVLDSGIVCAHFNSIKKKGFCPRDKVALEMNAVGNPDLQANSLSAVGSFFDLQKNSTPEQRRKTAEAILKNLELAKEGAKKECAQFPSNMRGLLSDLHALHEKELAAIETRKQGVLARLEKSKAKLDEYHQKKASLKAEIEQYQKQIDDLNAEKNAKLAKVEDKKETWTGKLFPGGIKRRKEKITDDYDTKIRQIQYPKSTAEINYTSLDLGMFDELSLLRSVDDLNKQVDAVKAKMEKIGTRVPDPESPVANSTKFVVNPAVEEKLQTDFRNTMTKHKYSEIGFDQFSKMATKFLETNGLTPASFEGRDLVRNSNERLEGDFMQTNLDRCISAHVSKNRDQYRKSLTGELACFNSKLVDPAVSLIPVLGVWSNANMDVESLLADMDNKTFDFMDSLIGSTCEDRDRIKVPGSLSCKVNDVFDYVVAQGGYDPFNDAKVTAKVADRFQKAVRASIDSGRGVLLGVCSDMFYDVSADGAFGTNCRDGGHGVTLIGYRCKAGKINYLIQNSWGPKSGPYGEGAEQDNGRVWVQESLTVRNVFDYGVFEGSVK